MQNGFVESFNGRIRDEFLNETLFRNLGNARELIPAWVTDDNTARPHSALCYPTALLPSQGVTWSAVDETSARATLTDGRLVLNLLFPFGPDGPVSSIHADARAAPVKGVSVLLSWADGEAPYLTADGEQSCFRGTVMRIGYRFHPQRA